MGNTNCLHNEKGRIFHFCFDFKNLSNLAQESSYPILKMKECIDSLGEATIFSTLDDNNGYYLV